MYRTKFCFFSFLFFPFFFMQSGAKNTQTSVYNINRMQIKPNSALVSVNRMTKSKTRSLAQILKFLKTWEIEQLQILVWSRLGSKIRPNN